MRDVFLCCAPGNEEIASRVCRFLEAEKISCWFAARDLALGEDPQAMTGEAVNGCPVIVLIFSREADASVEVQDQVERALRAEKILIPLRIENAAPTGRLEAALRHRFRQDAFVGPLERHLPELVRMLKPLLHRLVLKTREATSISRTLPSRASIVRGAEGGTTAAVDGKAQPLTLAFHFPHPVFAGHPALVEVKATGTFEGKAEMTIEGLGLKRRVMVALEDLQHRPEQIHRIPFDPARSGTFPLHAVVTLTDATTRTQLAGRRSLRINAERAMSDLVRVEDIMVNHDKAEMFLAQPAATKEMLPLSELLVYPLEQNFEPMELTREYEVERWAFESLKPARPLEIPEPFQGRGQTGRLLRLEPEESTPDLPFQEIRLVARQSFSVGRSREESDYLAWFWPRNDVHDTKTRRISKKHCVFMRDGARIVIQNVAAGSLTTFDAQDLAGEESLLLDGIGMLNLSGIYQLDVARFPSTLPSTPAAAPHEETPRGSVSFTSCTPNTLPQHALWLLTDGSFGSSRANPLPLDFPDLAEIQGRFHYDQGLFWIETVADNGALEVDDHTLVRAQVVPLAQGMKIRMGGRTFCVAIEA
jgi:hypothetical protein